MIVAAAPLGTSLVTILWGIGQAFTNVAFTGSLLLSFAMSALVLVYAKRRPKGTELTWGQAMVAALYVSFLLFFFFGVVPDRWMVYASGELGMRSDSILAGPKSTGLLGPGGVWQSFPITVTKAAVADTVTTIIYGIGLGGTVALWGAWQKRGEGQTDEVETSTYGRPLVKT